MADFRLLMIGTACVLLSTGAGFAGGVTAVQWEDSSDGTSALSDVRAIESDLAAHSSETAALSSDLGRLEAQVTRLVKSVNELRQVTEEQRSAIERVRARSTTTAEEFERAMVDLNAIGQHAIGLAQDIAILRETVAGLRADRNEPSPPPGGYTYCMLAAVGTYGC